MIELIPGHDSALTQTNLHIYGPEEMWRCESIDRWEVTAAGELVVYFPDGWLDRNGMRMSAWKLPASSWDRVIEARL